MNDIEEAISYIESTKKYLLHLGETWYADYLDDALELLKEQDAKTGKWIAPEEEGCLIYDPNVYVQCSVCGKKAQYGKKDKYCRNCGAMMEV